MTSNLRTACQRCRKRKIKCDLKAPRCGHCAGAKVACQSSVLTSSRAASSLPPGFLESLEAEVMRLEKETSSPQSVASAAYPSQQRQSISDDREYGGAESSFDWSCIGGADLVRLHPHLAYGLHRMIMLAMGVDNRHPSHSRRANPLFSHARHASSFHPAQELTRVYLNNYFTAVHGAFPILDKVTAQEHLDIASTGEAIESPVLLMVLAIGAVFSTEQGTLATYDAIELFLAASRCCLTIATENGPELVQFLLLASLFSLFNSTGGSTWHLLGLAVQTCISQGLHQKRVTSNQPGNKDMLSNVFWAVFVLDRLVSTSLGRPFNIENADITAEPPWQQDAIPGLHSLTSLALLSSEKINLRDTDMPGIRAIQIDLRQHGFSRQERGIFDSFAVQLLVWVTLDPQHLLSIQIPEHEVLQNVSDTLNSCLRQCHAQSQGLAPNSWPTAYTVFHAAVLQTLLEKQQFSQMSNESEAPTRVTSAPGLSTASSIFIKSLALGFPGLNDLHVLYELVLGCSQAREPGVALLAVLQNRWSRFVVSRLFNMGSER